jgi:NTP pyrophosphatase (non-canonical NTP hydrolase)
MENKVRKGFNVSDIHVELCLLQGEIAEFFQAWRSKRPDVGEELADVAIYLLGLAGILDIDLQTEVGRKIRKNADRQYVRRANGVLVKEHDSA